MDTNGQIFALVGYTDLSRHLDRQADPAVMPLPRNLDLAAVGMVASFCISQSFKEIGFDRDLGLRRIRLLMMQSQNVLDHP